MKDRSNRLSDEQVAQFERDGYVTGIRVLAPGEVLRFRQRIDAIRRNLREFEPRLYEVDAGWSRNPDTVICHFLGGWLVDTALRDLVFDRRLTVPLAQLLGVERLRFWHDQVFYKPPRSPAVVPWHQDFSYWTRTEPAAHITINIMLDDADEENGCVEFVPGSHRWGLLPSLPFDSPREAIREHLTAEQIAAFKPVHACLRAGEASIHHSHTLHGSAGNRSDRPRRAMVFNYMAADTRVADDSAPLLRHVARLRKGAIVEGEHFPIVLGRASAPPTE